MTCCTHACNEGRDCTCSLNATRAVFGLPPVLHEGDGGHRVVNSLSAPLEPPEPARPARLPAWRWLVVVAGLSYWTAVVVLNFHPFR